MEQTDSYKRDGGGGDWLTESAGISQRTYMCDPWTWITVWGLTMEVEGWVEGRKRGKIRTTVIA